MNIHGSTSLNTDQSPMTRSAEERGDIRYDSDFSKIEELIKRNNFTREEISHLMEILNSRVDNEWEKQKLSSDARGDTQLVTWMHEVHTSPSEERRIDSDRTVIGAFREKSDNVQVPVGVSSSPIDIARAYMAGRTSEGAHDLYNFKLKNERSEPSNEFTRKTILPPPSPKPSICWPGAMVHDRHGYATPLSERRRNRIHDFPRTPYSRTILAKSATKLQGDSRYAKTSTPFQPSQTSVYGQLKSRGDNVDGYGSVGPIRRVRNKFTSLRPRGSIFLNSSKDISLESATSKNFGSSPEKNLEPGETSGASKYWSRDNASGSSDRGITNPNLSSSEAVRKILEHLDRNLPTPKEKEAELQLVSSWRSISPEARDTIREENTSPMHVEVLGSHKNTDTSGPIFPMEFSKIGSKSNYDSKDTANGNAIDTSAVASGSSVIPGASAIPIFALKGTSDPVVKNLNENAFATANHGQPHTSFNFPHPNTSNGGDFKTLSGITHQELPKNHGFKPLLSSISINKPNFRAVSSDNGPSFSFPVSTSSGTLSEPPTPSIGPSIVSQPITTGPAIPSYTFGTNKSIPRLVFSFPSTSSASTHDDPNLKYSFGSDKTTRLSFGSLGKDAVAVKPRA